MKFLCDFRANGALRDKGITPSCYHGSALPDHSRVGVPHILVGVCARNVISLGMRSLPPAGWYARRLARRLAPHVRALHGRGLQGGNCHLSRQAHMFNVFPISIAEQANARMEPSRARILAQ